MNRRWRLLYLVPLFLLVAFSLIACERPAPVELEAEATNTPVSEIATSIAEAPLTPSQTPEEVDTPREEANTPTPEVNPTAEPLIENAAETEAEPTETEVAPTETAENPAPEAETTEETAELPETHTVAAGDTLYRIGLQYGISWVTLAEINNIATPNRLLVGQEIRLQRNINDPAPTPSPNIETTHVVQPGENLFRIGLQYGMTWIQIAEANGLVNPNQITVGQTLKIPIEVSGPPPEFVHTVQQNETLLTISLLYGVPWQAIAQANELTSPYLIFPEQQLNIPSS